MSKVIGIDLGTTNSVVAVVEGGEPVVIPSAEGDRTIPSVVAFSKTGELMVGQVAKRQAVTNPDGTVLSIKRRMGTDYRVTIGGKEYTPQQISALILGKLRDQAEAYLGEEGDQSGNYRPRLLHRRPKAGDERCGNHRGLGGPQDHKRAHRGRVGLWPR